MPIQKTIYDKETGETLVRDGLTAAEAVANDPDRYAYKPWKVPAGGSKKDDAKARAAAKAAKKTDDPFDHDNDGKPGGSLPKAEREGSAAD